MTDIQDIIKGWQTGELQPCKDILLDCDAYNNGASLLSCLCAQGQILHLIGGFKPEDFDYIEQEEVDEKVATILNISRAHSVLLRQINDNRGDPCFVVLTNPAEVLGNQWSKLLDFWWMLDNYSKDDWVRVKKAHNEAWTATTEEDLIEIQIAIKTAVRIAAGWDAEEAAWDATASAVYDMLPYARHEREMRKMVKRAGALASAEIQSYAQLTQENQKPFFLPMFGINTLDDIPPRPANYGNGIVPKGDANSCLQWR
jgi:hypothetical protein